jgi:hypothetical protein
VKELLHELVIRIGQKVGIEGDRAFWELLFYIFEGLDTRELVVLREYDLLKLIGFEPLVIEVPIVVKDL